jgi:hypothetical protein
VYADGRAADGYSGAMPGKFKKYPCNQSVACSARGSGFTYFGFCGLGQRTAAPVLKELQIVV